MHTYVRSHTYITYTYEHTIEKKEHTAPLCQSTVLNIIQEVSVFSCVSPCIFLSSNGVLWPPGPLIHTRWTGGSPVC